MGKHTFFGRRIALLVLATAALALGLVACGGGGGKAASVTGVKITASVAELEKGDTFAFKAEVEPSNAGNKEIEWSSSDPSVISIGAATGAARAEVVSAAPVTITATSKEGGFKKEVQVTAVPVKVTRVSVTPSNQIISLNGTIAGPLSVDLQFTADVACKAGLTLDEGQKTVIWESSDSTIASFDKSTPGLATLKKAGGPVTITATSVQTPNIKGAAGLTVAPPPAKPVESIAFVAQVPTKVERGKSTVIGFTVLPANADDKTVTPSSDKNDVATVANDGTGAVRVTGVSVGSATIKVTANDGSGVSANHQVEVVQPSAAKVYIAGAQSISTGSTANDNRWADGAVWIDGERQIIFPYDGPRNTGNNGRSTFGYSVNVADDGTVRVAGHTYKQISTNSSYADPALWTKTPGGEPRIDRLPVPDSPTGSVEVGYAHSVFVKGSEVYVAGRIYAYNTALSFSGYIPAIWKNNVLQPYSITSTTDPGAFASSIYVTGNNTVVTGGQSSSSYGAARPCVWIGGNIQILSSLPGEVQSIFVVEGTNTLYATGKHRTEVSLYTYRYIPMLWVVPMGNPSGYTSVQLAEGGSESGGSSNGMSGIDQCNKGNSVFVDGSNVYVVGNVSNATITEQARMWKIQGSGQPVETALSTRPVSNALSVYVHQGDVYVVGYEKEDASSGLTPRQAVLWKNGDRQPIGDPQLKMMYQDSPFCSVVVK